MSRQSRLALFALLPSVFSSTVCGVALGLILGIADWAFITHNAVLYHYLFGPNGFAGIVHPPSLGLGASWHHLSAQLSATALASYLFVLLIAVIMYTVIEFIAHTATSVERSTTELLHLQAVSRQRLLREIGERTAARFVVVIAWLLYSLTLFKSTLAWCIGTSRFGIATIDQWKHIGYIVLSLAALLLALHVHIVLLRLFTLRARVFGGTDVLLAAEQKPTVHRTA